MNSHSIIDPYELIIISPNDKAKMIMSECLQVEPNTELIQMLINLGANINWVNDFSLTPLHFATVNNKPEIVRMLIEAGSDIHAKESHGLVALHFAVWHSPEIVKMLLEYGEDVDVQDDAGYTPLHWTAYFSKADIATILIEAGANQQIKNILGYTWSEFWKLHDKKVFNQ